jgi:hypothetical protein
MANWENEKTPARRLHWDQLIPREHMARAIQKANFYALLQPSKRAGRNNTARSNAKMALTVMPMRRNGSESSHTSGRRMSASNAMGQHSTKRMHQPINRMSAFMIVCWHYYKKRQLWRGGGAPNCLARSTFLTQMPKDTKAQGFEAGARRSPWRTQVSVCFAENFLCRLCSFATLR